MPSFGSTQQFNGPFYPKLLQTAFGLYVPQSYLYPFFEFMQQFSSIPCTYPFNGSVEILSRQQLGPPDNFIAWADYKKIKSIVLKFIFY